MHDIHTILLPFSIEKLPSWHLKTSFEDFKLLKHNDPLHKWSADIELPYVNVKIVRVNRPFPLKDIFVEEEEVVTLIPGVLFNATFDGDEFHNQVYYFVEHFYSKNSKQLDHFKDF